MFNVCENCKSDKIIVINTRDKGSFIHRRRKCLKCGVTFGTREIRQDEYEQLKREKPKFDPEVQFRRIIRLYVSKLTAKEQTEFFNEIIK